MTQEEEKAVREKFEAWVSASLRNFDIARWPMENGYAWPGQYKSITVQFAWEAVQEAMKKP